MTVVAEIGTAAKTVVADVIVVGVVDAATPGFEAGDLFMVYLSLF
jgi:hypothetical protein